ncbi:MAG: hypothetical protein LBM02_09680 [Lachnospiraceae bacterium]|jgi:hypothetical protein|nr:hypothetical protein [Lachnospiraceae bacterium]
MDLVNEMMHNQVKRRIASAIYDEHQLNECSPFVGSIYFNKANSGIFHDLRLAELYSNFRKCEKTSEKQVILNRCLKIYTTEIEPKVYVKMLNLEIVENNDNKPCHYILTLKTKYNEELKMCIFNVLDILFFVDDMGLQVKFNCVIKTSLLDDDDVNHYNLRKPRRFQSNNGLKILETLKQQRDEKRAIVDNSFNLLWSYSESDENKIINWMCKVNHLTRNPTKMLTALDIITKRVYGRNVKRVERYNDFLSFRDEKDTEYKYPCYVKRKDRIVYLNKSFSSYWDYSNPECLFWITWNNRLEMLEFHGSVINTAHNFKRYIAK